MNITKDKHGQYNLWQRRYWEHTIKDTTDYQNHVNYIHYNPIKHGYVSDLNDWLYSSYHQYVKKQILPKDWGKDYNVKSEINFGE